MDEDFQIMYLLMSLSLSWENVSQTLSLQKGVVLNEVEGRLVVEGQRQAARSLTPTNSVMIAKTKNNNGA